MDSLNDLIWNPEDLEDEDVTNPNERPMLPICLVAFCHSSLSGLRCNTHFGNFDGCKK